jgi:hypothetical protein
MEGITPEVQRDVFTKALHEHLFQPKHSSDRGTPLTHAFDRALNDAVTGVANKMMTEEPYKTQIRDAIHDAFDKAMTEGSFVKTLATRIVNAVGRSY